MTQKKADRKQKAYMQSILPNTLAVQKKEVKRAAMDFLTVSILFLLLAIGALIVALTHENRVQANLILCGAFPILTVFCAAFVFFSVRRFLMLRLYKNVRFGSEEAINTDCKKLRFIFHPVGRDLFYLLGVVFIDACNKKYIYILPNRIYDVKNKRAELRRKCERKQIELLCYEGSRMVKHFDFGK